MEITKSEQQKGKKKYKEDSLRDLWDNIRHSNICIIRVPEGENREKGPENLLEEIMADLPIFYRVILFFFFLIRNYMRCLVILEINSVSVALLAHNFSHSEDCLFILFMVYFAV